MPEQDHTADIWNQQEDEQNQVWQDQKKAEDRQTILSSLIQNTCFKKQSQILTKIIQIGTQVSVVFFHWQNVLQRWVGTKICVLLTEKLQLPNDQIKVSPQMDNATAQIGELFCAAHWTVLSPQHKSNPVKQYWHLSWSGLLVLESSFPANMQGIL